MADKNWLNPWDDMPEDIDPHEDPYISDIFSENAQETLGDILGIAIGDFDYRLPFIAPEDGEYIPGDPEKINAHARKARQHLYQAAKEFADAVEAYETPGSNWFAKCFRSQIDHFSEQFPA